MKALTTKKRDNPKNLENKKKARIEGKITQQNMTSFSTKPNAPRLPSALKQGKCTSNSHPELIVDLIDTAYAGSLCTYSYLIVDIPPDRDFIEKHRSVLSKLFSLIKLPDLQAVIVQCEVEPEKSNNKKHYARS